MLNTFVTIVHIFVCVVLMLVVLLQQGKGGGMGAAFGGATSQVFGGRGAGNILTRATAVCAATFMITSVALASMSGGEDRALKAKAAEQAARKKDRGTVREKSSASPSSSAAPSAAPPSSAAPADGEAPKP